MEWVRPARRRLPLGEREGEPARVLDQRPHRAGGHQVNAIPGPRGRRALRQRGGRPVQGEPERRLAEVVGQELAVAVRPRITKLFERRDPERLELLDGRFRDAGLGQRQEQVVPLLFS